jgi:hypothetical protein
MACCGDLPLKLHTFFFAENIRLIEEQKELNFSFLCQVEDKAEYAMSLWEQPRECAIDVSFLFVRGLSGLKSMLASC